jgi:hypothetical protein
MLLIHAGSLHTVLIVQQSLGNSLSVTLTPVERDTQRERDGDRWRESVCEREIKLLRPTARILTSLPSLEDLGTTPM